MAARVVCISKPMQACRNRSLYDYKTRTLGKKTELRGKQKQMRKKKKKEKELINQTLSKGSLSKAWKLCMISWHRKDLGPQIVQPPVSPPKK